MTNDPNKTDFYLNIANKNLTNQRPTRIKTGKSVCQVPFGSMPNPTSLGAAYAALGKRSLRTLSSVIRITVPTFRSRYSFLKIKYILKLSGLLFVAGGQHIGGFQDHQMIALVAYYDVYAALAFRTVYFYVRARRSLDKLATAYWAVSP